MPRPWVARPWVDLMVGCGGWSLPLLALAYAMPAADGPWWAGAFYSLALLANYPHYMATVYRAYGSGGSGHRLHTVYGTTALVLLGALAHAEPALLPLLFTAYVFWSPWHYTGQNYGLLVMFLRRAGIDVSIAERRLLRTAFIASYALLLLAFNEGPSADSLVLSAGLSGHAVRGIGMVTAAVFLGCAAAAFVSLVRRTPARTLLAPLVLATTQALWFVAPIVGGWISGAAAPQTRYSSGVLAVMHAWQYLWITRFFARRAEGPAWSEPRYWVAVVVGGMALFLPVPWMASYGARIDFTTSMLIVTAVVNLHHFMIDGVVWKLRDPKVGRTLTSSEPLTEAPRPTPAAAWRRLAFVMPALAVVVLAGVDQARYWLALDTASPQALQTAVRLNPYDAPSQNRLLQALLTRGDFAAARTQIEAMLAQRPDDADTLVNAGVLARRTDRPDDAERYWQRAVALVPGASHVHLYLAELYDERDRPSDAARAYRAFLGLVAAQRSPAQTDVATVARVVDRFAKALERSGEPRAARTQFELAARLARQAGLPELAASAEAHGAQQP